MGVARVRVDHVLQRAYDRVGRHTLCDRTRRQRKSGRRIVRIGDVDREGLVDGETGAVGNAHRYCVDRHCLEIEQRAVGDLQLATGDLEAPAGVVDQAEHVGVADVRVDHTLQGAHDRVRRRTLCHRVRRQREVGRCLAGWGRRDDDVVDQDLGGFAQRCLFVVEPANRDRVVTDGQRAEIDLKQLPVGGLVGATVAVAG